MAPVHQVQILVGVVAFNELGKEIKHKYISSSFPGMG